MPNRAADWLAQAERDLDQARDSKTSTSSVLKWPDRETVDAAARRWARQQAGVHPELVRLGYFGSYARGDWGVGSDLDLIAIVTQAERPFAERGLDWDLSALPVPAEILVYTETEWAQMAVQHRRLRREVDADGVWLTRCRLFECSLVTPLCGLARRRPLRGLER